ncbi:hypothetical protein ACVBEF_14900 [Glaciimonas sp. GG7]
MTDLIRASSGSYQSTDTSRTKPVSSCSKSADTTNAERFRRYFCDEQDKLKKDCLFKKNGVDLTEENYGVEISKCSYSPSNDPTSIDFSELFDGSIDGSDVWAGDAISHTKLQFNSMTSSSVIADPIQIQTPALAGHASLQGLSGMGTLLSEFETAAAAALSGNNQTVREVKVVINSSALGATLANIVSTPQYVQISVLSASANTLSWLHKQQKTMSSELGIRLGRDVKFMVKDDEAIGNDDVF